MWFELCCPGRTQGPNCAVPDMEVQVHMLDFVTVFEHFKKQSGWRCRHEVVEAFSSIGAGGLQDPNTTFNQFVLKCMDRPGAYVLTVANHCTVAASHSDGTVEWANSLGRCLEPGVHAQVTAKLRMH